MLAEDRALKQRISDVARRFHGEYAVWLRTYVMKSPFAGKITFFKFRKENQFAVSGENVSLLSHLFSNAWQERPFLLAARGK
ncbi:hypothetical protein [Chitinophaga eiseniae]|uniref:hypothetical protein n=1 Tax=Chitinophaga eiseniae TaxID=634771 RepID=UPI00099ADCE7|nr:hypothetical protein [Chitinophaga eiseniae]